MKKAIKKGKPAPAIKQVIITWTDLTDKGINKHRTDIFPRNGDTIINLCNFVDCCIQVVCNPNPGKGGKAKKPIIKKIY